MPTKKKPVKAAKKPVKATKKAPRKSTRKTPRKSDKMLVETLGRIDKVIADLPSPSASPLAGLADLCLRGKPIPEPEYGVGGIKPGTYFDQPVVSPLIGLTAVEPDTVPCKAKQGLDKAKQIIEFCECPTSMFENWRARLSTDQGTYELVGPKRITRDRVESRVHLNLFFGKLEVAKTIRLYALNIVDGHGETIGANSFDIVASAGDFVNVNYYSNV